MVKEGKKSTRKIACILPMSQSKYRHRNSQDFIHMSGLILIREYLKKKKFDVRCFDFLRFEGNNSFELNQELDCYRPDVLCICGMFCIEDIVDFVNAHKALFQRGIGIACGTGALDYKVCLQKIDGINYVIPTNPEFVISDIIDVEEGKLDIVDLYGAAYQQDSQIFFRKRKTDDFNELFDGISVENYISFTDKSLAYLWSSRGCWYRLCTFCNVGAASSLCTGNAWQIREVPKVIDDIKELYGRGVAKFHFLDAEFIGPGQIGQERAREFANELILSGMNISFYVDIRADCIEKTTIDLLCKAGLKSIFIGVESVSDFVLDTIKKGYKSNIIARALEVIREKDLKYRIGTLLAIPESRLEDIEKTLDYYLENNIYQALNIVGVGSIFHELHLHLGTPIYRSYQEYIGNNGGWSGEIDCYYIDEKVRTFIAYAKIIHNMIIVRYKGSNERNLDNQFLKKYQLSLRIIAVTGLKRLIQGIQNKSDLDEVIDNIFMKHDKFWAKQGGHFLYGINGTAISI